MLASDGGGSYFNQEHGEQPTHPDSGDLVRGVCMGSMFGLCIGYICVVARSFVCLFSVCLSVCLYFFLDIRTELLSAQPCEGVRTELLFVLTCVIA